MEIAYAVPTDSLGIARDDSVFRSDGTWIPADPANSDYHAYLNWVSEGNKATSLDRTRPAL